MTEIETDYFDDFFTVSAKQGFAVAAGVVNFEDNVVEDLEIGSLEFYILYWTCGTCAFEFRKLKTRPCTL